MSLNFLSKKELLYLQMKCTGKIFTKKESTFALHAVCWKKWAKNTKMFVSSLLCIQFQKELLGSVDWGEGIYTFTISIKMSTLRYISWNRSPLAQIRSVKCQFKWCVIPQSKMWLLKQRKNILKKLQLSSNPSKRRRKSLPNTWIPWKILTHRKSKERCMLFLQ